MTTASSVQGRQFVDEAGAVYVFEARDGARGRCLAWARPHPSRPGGVWQVRDLRRLRPQEPAGARVDPARLVTVEDAPDRRAAVARLDAVTEGWS